jgi:hypothetical protein
MIFITYTIISWLLGMILIDWKKWRLGYPTALFGSLVSFFLDTAFAARGFWSYSDPLLPGLWPNILLNLSLYPVGIWIFVQRFPKTTKYKVVWILIGLLILLIEEMILQIVGRIHYHNGWNFVYSALTNLLLLGLLTIHFNVVELRSAEKTGPL